MHSQLQASSTAKRRASSWLLKLLKWLQTITACCLDLSPLCLSVSVFLSVCLHFLSVSLCVRIPFSLSFYASLSFSDELSCISFMTTMSTDANSFKADIRLWSEFVWTFCAWLLFKVDSSRITEKTWNCNLDWLSVIISGNYFCLVTITRHLFDANLFVTVTAICLRAPHKISVTMCFKALKVAGYLQCSLTPSL